MKPLRCYCGQTVFFDDRQCLTCGRSLAFDPQSLTMVAETSVGDGLAICLNRNEPLYCNWLAPTGGKCLSCQTSQVIPTLSKEENRGRWRRLEQAKRRLISNLLSLGLPVTPGDLRFEFKEDRRTNPTVREEHVAIGHLNGVITINAAEADAVFREEMRQAMNEPYRTVLGHFRHESGHYYQKLILDEAGWERCRELFGDERRNYDQALEQHYVHGPPADWPETHISAYAAAHPLEDWAECWAHYLHLRDFLETAETMGLAQTGKVRTHNEGDWLAQSRNLAMGVNEMTRSLGLPDPYPFVIRPVVADKLNFIHHAIGQFTNPPVGP